LKINKIDKVAIKIPLKNGPSTLTLNKTKPLYQIAFGILFVNSFILENILFLKQNFKKEYQKITLASFYLLEIKSKTTSFLSNISILCLSQYFTHFSTLFLNQEANLTINLRKNY
jgi:hypothetical protein